MADRRKRCRTCHKTVTAKNRKGYCSPACWYASPVFHRTVTNSIRLETVRAKRKAWSVKYRSQKFEVLLRRYGFWVTPELLQALQGAWTLGYNARGAQISREKAA